MNKLRPLSKCNFVDYTKQGPYNTYGEFCEYPREAHCSQKNCSFKDKGCNNIHDHEFECECGPDGSRCKEHIWEYKEKYRQQGRDEAKAEYISKLEKLKSGIKHCSGSCHLGLLSED